MEFFLAGDLLGDVELAADLIGRVEQRHLMAAAGGGGGEGQPGGAGADHRQLFRFLRHRQRHFGFAAGARVDQARRQLAFKKSGRDRPGCNRCRY